MNSEAVLRLLLSGSQLIAFEYWTDFILRLQRAEENSDDEAVFPGVTIPEYLSLRLRGPWWVGDLREWRQQIASFPVKPAPGIPPDGPLQAATLTRLLGSTILTVQLEEPGTMILNCSSDDTIHIAGTGTEEEESWLLESFVEDSEEEPWYILCDKNGDLFGKWPEAK